MRKLFFIVGLLGASTAFAQNFSLKGELSGLDPNTKVILSDLNGKKFHDTATVTHNNFQIDCQLPGAGIYVLRVGLVGQEPEHRVFYLENGSVRLKGVRGKLKSVLIESEDAYMKDFESFTEGIEQAPVVQTKKILGDSIILLSGRTGSYQGAFDQPGLIDRFVNASQKVEDLKVNKAKEWLAAHPDSDINAYVIYTYLRETFNSTELKAQLAKLNNNALKSLPGQYMLHAKNSNRRRY